MKWRSSLTATPSVLIALGAALWGGLVADVCLRPLSGRTGHRLPGLLEAAALAGLSLAVTGLVFFKELADRDYRTDRELLNAFLEYIPDNVYFKDRGSRFLRLSRATANHFGLSDPEQMVHKTDSDFFTSEHAEQAFADEQKIIVTGQAMAGLEEKETWPDGHETWMFTTKVPLKDRQGRIVGTMGISRNITDRKQAELRIRHMALHDALTGLPNRTLLEDLLAQAIALAGRNRKRVAVFMLDLDRFKNVNDTFGHHIGDRLLEAVSVRLTGSLRESDIAARLAGDEFVICLPLVEHYEDMEHVAYKLRSALAEPFRVDGHELEIGASIGICAFPDHGESPKELLQAADIAMYEAKRTKPGTHRFFTIELSETTRRRQKLESELQHALAQGEFLLYYQPLVAVDSGAITGVEALLRWRHREHGILLPNQFLPHLEELGLMAEVANWVLQTACVQNALWQREGLAPIRIAVNLSSTQFYRANIVSAVKRALQHSGLQPKWLDLELTELLTLDDSETTLKTMLALKETGVTLSLDDFGTGWSSLSCLRRFPIDRLKIDRSFLPDLAAEPAAEAVIKSILNLARDLGLTCVAEGVETPQQLDFFRRQNCTEAQGFLFSPAVPESEFRALLRAARVQLPGELPFLPAQAGTAPPTDPAGAPAVPAI